MERSVDREPLSRVAIGALVASAGVISYALATAQETSDAWMSTRQIAFPGGVVLGWILALLPGLLLDVVRGI